MACLLQADVTLRGLWSSGYQVVLSYEDQAAAHHKELWPEIPYWWGNTASAEELVQYLDSRKHLGRPGHTYSSPNSSSHRYKQGFSLSLEVTKTTKEIFSDFYMLNLYGFSDDSGDSFNKC